MANVQPLEDHILVKPQEQENTTKSGIILPDNNQEKPSVGQVIAVGDGKILDNGQRGPVDVSVWDTVYFTKYAPDEIDVDGETLLVVKQSSILAKAI